MSNTSPLTAVPFRQNKLFRQFPEDLLGRIEPNPVGYGADEVIFREGDPAECLFLIEEGTVRISKIGRGGRQETLAYFEAGDFFGEMGLYGQTTRSARATAVGPVVATCLDREPFEELLRSSPAALVSNLLEESVTRLRETDARLIREMLEAERMTLIGTMLSSIIHDIRGPLSVIQGTADLLSRDIDSEKRSKFTAMIRRSVKRIAEMVQELLDFSRGTTRLQLQAITPRDLMTELADEVFASLPPTVDVKSTVLADDLLTVDRSRFFRVLQNIVKNAAEAMPTGGQITILIASEGSSTRFEISDTGSGIPADILPTIFEPFVTHGKSSGTGLGMAIAKSVVEAHEGTIRATSVEGTGTTFTILLPRKGPKESH